MGADEGQEREEEKRNRDAALEQRQCIRTKKRDRKRELFLATLGYVSFLSFSYFSTLSRFSFSRLCPITHDSWPFFRRNLRKEESHDERRKERSSREMFGRIAAEERRKSRMVEK